MKNIAVAIIAIIAALIITTGIISANTTVALATPHEDAAVETILDSDTGLGIDETTTLWDGRN